MKKYLFLFLLISGTAFAISPDLALEQLMEGNKRYTSDKLEHPSRTSDKRQEISSKQKPFAIVLGCSDSRVTPEILFDQGLGDIFTVRVAGNVIGPIELDSIEFAAIHFGSAIIMVLGHENCGAVNAVIKGTTQDIESIATLIYPAVKNSKDMTGDRLVNAIEMNVMDGVQQLKNSKPLSQLIEKGKLKIVGGYYHLNTGAVEMLE